MVKIKTVVIILKILVKIIEKERVVYGIIIEMNQIVVQMLII